MTAQGFVLVGGESRRMGRDKALLDAAGAPQVTRVAEVVKRVTGAVALLGPPDRYLGLGYEVWADTIPGCGPLGGVVTALSRSSADLALILACDLGNVPESFLRELLRVASSSGAGCVAAETAAGELQPLCAVWRQSAAGVLREQLLLRNWKMREVLRKIHTVSVRATGEEWLKNLNTPAEWNSYVTQLKGVTTEGQRKP